MHVYLFIGVADSCNNEGLTQFIEHLSEWSNSHGYCMYSLFNPLLKCVFLFFVLKNALFVEKLGMEYWILGLCHLTNR